jgi:glycosyltransferase involved in cell wall biosynthesis
MSDLKLSVILPTPDTYATIRKTIRYLNQQTVKESLELVIVAPSAENLGIETSDLEAFGSSQIVEIGAMKSIAWAYASGIRKARAELVALGEDHCYPDSDWAENLIAAHQGSWAAVGPVLRNANPHSAVSWADMLIAYAPWLEPATAGEVEHLPGHNSSYKREILLAYGDRLEAMMEAESLLHWDLRAKGYQLYLEPKAKSAHTNFGELGIWIPVQYNCGRLFASDRADNEQWSWGKRLIYFAASPLIPFVRLARIFRYLQQRPERSRLFWQTLPMLLLGLGIDGVGQGIGYLFGSGNSMQKLSEYEFHRDRYQGKSQDPAIATPPSTV